MRNFKPVDRISAEELKNRQQLYTEGMFTEQKIVKDESYGKN